MKRRHFTLALAATLCGLGASLWRRARASGSEEGAGQPPQPLRHKDVIDAAIAEYLPYLQVSDEEIARFRRACRKNRERLTPKRKEKLATLFLMSSDFFANGEKVELPVHFVTLYGPYRAPCYQPLMNLNT